MIYLKKFWFSINLINLLLFLLINSINSHQILNRRKRLDDSMKDPMIFMSMDFEPEEEFSAEEIPCSRNFKRESNSLHRLSLCRPPRKRLVPLRMPSKYYMPGVFHRPNSYEVERCDGVCQHPNYKCLPIEKEMIEVPVTSDSSTTHHNTSPGTPTDKCMRIKIERHKLCGCQCSMTEQNCNEKQVFSNDKCACECTDMSMARTCSQNNRMWSNEKCECVCPSTTLRQCSSGAIFDETTCRCVQNNS